MFAMTVSFANTSSDVLAPSFLSSYLWKWIFWKPFQRLERAAKKCPGKKKFLQCQKILKDYKTEWNSLKIPKRVFLGEFAVPQSLTLSKNKLDYKYFSIDLSNF